MSSQTVIVKGQKDVVSDINSNGLEPDVFPHDRSVDTGRYVFVILTHTLTSVVSVRAAHQLC